MNEPLDDLLDQLSSGDSAAAARVYLEFEPYLRKAVRRHLVGPLRAKFDSSDILQSVWADVLRGFREAGWRFTDADHLRGFLFIATRNRLIDRARQHEKALAREERFGAAQQRDALPSPQPRPSELAQAGDLWQRIQEVCPPEHRLLLDLKRGGHSLAEIAAETGLHPDSVRRILRGLARQMAFGTPAADEQP